ncbi:MAG: hypothetical protein AB3N07_08270 [Ruegeria sp.]
MHKTVSVLLVVTLALSACGGWRDSGANPSNWFGGRSSNAPPPSPDDPDALLPNQDDEGGLFSRPVPEDTSIPIAVIDELKIDRTPSGAIIYATGTATRQGAYNARLVRVRNDENTKNGVLEYTFRVNYPVYATAQGTPRSRMVSDAVNVSRQELESVRLVRVSGAQNTLESRRR